MKKPIIIAGALSAILLLMFYCAESKYDNPFDNPLDKKGTNYLFGDTTGEKEKIGDANGNGISDLFDPKYTVTFYANGGIGSPPPAQTVLSGLNLSITLPSGEGLSRTGYTFDRWCTTPSGMGTYYDAGDEYTPSLSMSFYARWTENSDTQPSSDSTFVDSRDGKRYKKVTIGTQTWMAENLNFAADGSKCYGNNESNCTQYGRLYNWSTAMVACPGGWHLPSNEEWTALTDFVGGAATAGTKLKARDGWNEDGNGTNDFGWSALPGGSGGEDGRFYGACDDGNWWSATEGGGIIDWRRIMLYRIESWSGSNSYKSNLYSVRCVMDDN